MIDADRAEVRRSPTSRSSWSTTFADQAVIAIENVRLFDEIQDKSRQLAEASQHKSQFLASMSHELRTPLNAIIGVTEMLREDAESLNQDLEPLDRVLGAARHLLTLINDVLDLSKIEAGRMELHLGTFALAPLIDDVVKTIEPLAAKERKSGRRSMRQGDQDDARRSDQGPPDAAQPREQRQQVHRKGHGHDRCPAAGRERPRLDHDLGDGHRHRHDARADGQAVPGVFPGHLHDGEQIRRHRPWPRDQQTVLPDDGRGHHGRGGAPAGAPLTRPGPGGGGTPKETAASNQAPTGQPVHWTVGFLRLSCTQRGSMVPGSSAPTLDGVVLDQAWALDADLTGASMRGASLFATQLMGAGLDGAPPAITPSWRGGTEDKGARHVLEAQQQSHRDWYRYRQDFVSYCRPRSAWSLGAAPEVVA